MTSENKLNTRIFGKKIEYIELKIKLKIKPKWIN